MPAKKSLFEDILKIAKRKKRKIAICVIKPEKEIVDSLKKAKKIADIMVVGKKIAGFEHIPATYENGGQKMVQMYKKGEIDQFVRCQTDDFGTVEEFKKQFGINKDEKRLAVCLMKDYYNREFFLTMASNPEGQTYEDKLRITDGVCKWMQKEMKIKPKVAIMATCRPGSVGKDPVMTKSYQDADKLVKYLTDKGIYAKNIHIESNEGVKWCNLLVPANGTIGNQIFRALTLYGGGSMMLCPTIFELDNGKYLTYEDNSRNELDYYPHIVYATYLANSKEVK